MRRSSFFAATGGAMVVAALPPLSRKARASDLIEFSLTSAPLAFSPAPGVQSAGLAFNGSIPGPVLRVIHGQRMRTTFVNRSQSAGGETIHWHGMILPNAMDGADGITQSPVPDGGSFVYEFAPDPPGTRWYHDHANYGLALGLFGIIIVEDPNEEKADAEFALVFHDVPRPGTIESAMRGTSDAPMVDPLDSPELREMKRGDRMGDEVAYVAHCINGASYPSTKPLPVKVGQRVRLRILNANQTQTRYVRLAGHSLRVTHADGNPLARPLVVDALRIGVGERYDAWFEVTQPGAWLLQGLSSDPLAYEQAAVVYTEGQERATPMGSPQSLEGVDYFTYEKAAGIAASALPVPPERGQLYEFTLGGGEWASSKWTLNGRTYPDTQRILVNRGDHVAVRFKNTTDMDHAMHLHGHVFAIAEIDGKRLERPLAKDMSLVRANGGTLMWHFVADSPPGRWLLHCHNLIHMMDGMMTEVVYQ